MQFLKQQATKGRTGVQRIHSPAPILLLPTYRHHAGGGEEPLCYLQEAAPHQRLGHRHVDELRGGGGRKVVREGKVGDCWG